MFIEKKKGLTITATIILFNVLVLGINLKTAHALPLNSSSSVEKEESQFSWDIATDNVAAYGIIPLLDLQSMPEELSEKEDSKKHHSSRHKRASTVKKRVYTGVASSDITTLPYNAAVRISNAFCSGTLISDKHVLTAAHCVHNGRHYIYKHSQIKVGLLRGVGKFFWKEVSQIYISRAWKKSQGSRKKKSTLDADFAVLRLKNSHGHKYFKPKASKARLRSTIRFNGFPGNKNGALWHSSCPVEKLITSSVFLSRCSASKGTSGAGLYESLGFGQYAVTGVVSASIQVKNGKHTYKCVITNKLTPAKVRKICRWAGRNDC